MMITACRMFVGMTVLAIASLTPSSCSTVDEAARPNEKTTVEAPATTVKVADRSVNAAAESNDVVPEDSPRSDS